MTSHRISFFALLVGVTAPNGVLVPCSNAQEAPAPHAAFAQSLALRLDRVVADSDRMMIGWLAQTIPVAHTSNGALRLKVSLAPWEGDAKPVKELGSFTVYGGDLSTSPFPFSPDLRGVSDGFYRCIAQVFDGENALVKLERPLVLVSGLETKHAEFAGRLAKITGRRGTFASVLYPFDLARTINLGKRVYGSRNQNPEFGISPAGTQTLYDFPAGIKKSAELLAALEAGHDPLWRSGGDKERHYHMAEADEILPYRVYVPSTWDGKTALPLVFILHGNTRDHNFYHDRDGGVIPKTAERHGFMLVAPLGYAPSAGYNYVSFDRERGARGVAAAVASPQQFGRPAAPTATPTPAAGGRGGGGRGGAQSAGGVNGSTIPALVRSEWSEQDAMHVFDLIKREYPIDPKRVFLFGYSAGGQGAHYLGPKFAEHWAAIAVGGSNAALGPHYAVDRLKGTAMFLFSGAQDGVLNATRTLAQALQEKGVKAVFKEYPGINHDTAPAAATPDVFEFFKANPRK